MYVIASDTISIPVEFKASGGQLVVPDADSFNYTVIRLDGTVVLASVTPSLSETATEAIVTLSSPTTNMVTANDSESLIFKYSYDFEGLTFTNRLYLTLRPEPKYVVSAEKVRNTIGATELTLPDDMIDLHSAYVELKNSSDLGEANLDTLLLGGGYLAEQANRAILYLAALESLDRLALTLIKTHTEDNISVTHFETDLAALKSKMKGEYYTAVSKLNATLETELLTVSDLFVVATPTPDPTTGV